MFLCRSNSARCGKQWRRQDTARRKRRQQASVPRARSPRPAGHHQNLQLPWARRHRLSARSLHLASLQSGTILRRVVRSSRRPLAPHRHLARLRCRRRRLAQTRGMRVAARSARSSTPPSWSWMPPPFRLSLPPNIMAAISNQPPRSAISDPTSWQPPRPPPPYSTPHRERIRSLVLNRR